MIKEFKTFETNFNPTAMFGPIETFDRLQEKVMTLFKLPKNIPLYWLGVWELKHACSLNGIFPIVGISETDAFKCSLFAWCFTDFPNKFKFKLDWDVGFPTCDRLLKKNCFFFKALDELFYVELPESCVIDDAFLADRRLRVQNQFDAIQNSLKTIDDKEKKEQLEKKLEDLKVELEIWDLNVDLKKKRENMIVLLKECDLW